MAGLEALPDLQEVHDRLCDLLDRADFEPDAARSDWASVSADLRAAVDDARTVERLIALLLPNIDTHNHNNLRDEYAKIFIGLAAVLQASGDAGGARHWLERADVLAVYPRHRRLIATLSRHTAELLVLARVRFLWRTSRFDEAEALQEAAKAAASDPEIAWMFDIASF